MASDEYKNLLSIKREVSDSFIQSQQIKKDFTRFVIAWFLAIFLGVFAYHYLPKSIWNYNIYIANFKLPAHSIYWSLFLFGQLPLIYIIFYIPIQKRYSDCTVVKNSLNLFYELIENSSESVFIVSPNDGRIIDVNKKACEELQYSHSELVKLKVIDIEEIFETELDWQKEAEDLLANQSSKVIIGRQIKKDGSTFPVEVNASSVKFDNSIFIVAFARNISDRFAVETVKNEIINNVSHELKTPLAIIKTAIYNFTIGKHNTLNEYQEKSLDIITRNFWHLEFLILNLIDFSRFNAGEVDASDRENLDVYELLKRAEKSVSLILKTKSIDFEYDCEKTAPTIFGDKYLLNRVLVNILDNAIRFARSKISMTCHYDEEKGVIEICIEDDGGKIDAHQQAYLFDVLEQINRPKGGPGYKGVGIGLALAKLILKSHGGDIVYSDCRLDGACFKLTLPISRF